MSDHGSPDEILSSMTKQLAFDRKDCDGQMEDLVH